MKSDADRNASYNSKTAAATVGLIVAATLPDMRNNFADPAGMSDMVAKEQLIQGILNGNGSPTILYPFYLAFGRELWAVIRKGISGPALTNAAQGIRDKWNYGAFLHAPTLDEIALTVFNVVTV